MEEQNRGNCKKCGETLNYTWSIEYKGNEYHTECYNTLPNLFDTRSIDEKYEEIEHQTGELDFFD